MNNIKNEQKLRRFKTIKTRDVTYTQSEEKIVDLCRLWHNYLYERPEDDLDECIFVIGDTALVDIHNEKALKLSFLVHDMNIRMIPDIRWAYLSELMP